MADDLVTLADLIKINDQNANDAGATDLLQKAPLISRLHAVTASNGTQHKYLKETGAPVVGFRAVNAGRDHDKSGDTLVTVETEILDASFHVDKQIADGFRSGTDAFMTRETVRHLRAALKLYDSQLINGTAEGDAAGFEGFADALAALGDTCITGAATAARTSIYMIRTTPDEMNVSAVIANDGVIDVEDYFLQFVEEAGETKKFPAYMQPIDGRVAVAVGGKYSIVRIANVSSTGATGTTVDDDLLYAGLEAFKDGDPPNLILMNSTVRELIRQSRTATNGTGAPAPLPSDLEGIPIVVDNAIGNAESAVA